MGNIAETWTKTKPPEDREKRRLRRLGLGEYELPGETSIPLARVSFLEAVRAHIPDVLEHLSLAPFGLFQAVLPQVERHYLREWYALELLCQRIELSQDPPEWGTVLLHLRRRLLTWAKHWNLSDPWCLETAWETLFMWHLVPGMAAERQWSHGGGALTGVAGDDGEIAIVFPTWEWRPEWTTRAQAEQTIMAAVQEHLTRRLDEIEQLAQARGMERTRAALGDEAYVWLALYQVGKLSYMDVAQHATPRRRNKMGTPPSRQAITQAVKEAAKLTRLTLRPAQPAGRKGTPHTS